MHIYKKSSQKLCIYTNLPQRGIDFLTEFTPSGILSVRSVKVL